MMGLGRRCPPRVLGCPPGQKGRAGRQEGWGPLWPQFGELTAGPGDWETCLQARALVRVRGANEGSNDKILHLSLKCCQRPC